MNTKEVLKAIEDEGGFNNWMHWGLREIETWVRVNFECSKYVAAKVAWYIR